MNTEESTADRTFGLTKDSPAFANKSTATLWVTFVGGRKCILVPGLRHIETILASAVDFRTLCDLLRVSPIAIFARMDCINFSIPDDIDGVRLWVPDENGTLFMHSYWLIGALDENFPIWTELGLRHVVNNTADKAAEVVPVIEVQIRTTPIEQWDMARWADRKATHTKPTGRA